MAYIKVIVVGDIVGEPGLEALERELPALIKEHGASFVVVNGENAAEGFGMTAANLERIIACGADIVSSGNHIWEKHDFWPTLESSPLILRPANYPAGAKGRGWAKIQKRLKADSTPLEYLVINLQGREFMTAIDCPFKTFDSIIEGLCPPLTETNALYQPSDACIDKKDCATGSACIDCKNHSEAKDLFAKRTPFGKPGFITLVDFHAESTREKESLGYYVDGCASLFFGTHTHVQTADERILPQGTGYITDLGMTGVQDSIIGMEATICLNRAHNQVLYRMECAKGTGQVKGLLATIDTETAKAIGLERI
ncbi:TIGR00282 family metallophosphoesterase [Breznakiellaceae bacterium SP9]